MQLRLVNLLTIPCLLGLLVLSGCGKKEPLKEIRQSEYYPLQVDNHWKYRVGDRTISMKVTRYEKVAEAGCAVLETIVDGKVVATDYLKVADDGIYRVKQSGKVFEKPFLLLKLPPQMGEARKVKTKYKGEPVEAEFTAIEETVVVPAGSFQAIKVSAPDFATGDQKNASLTYWFAKEVGMVKQVLEVADQKVVFELEMFERRMQLYPRTQATGRE